MTIFQKNYQSQLHPFELQLAKSEKEKVLAEETKKSLQDYLQELESRENNEAEKFERARRQSHSVISSLEEKLKKGEGQALAFTTRTESLENTI